MTGKSRVLPALWKQCGYLTYTSASDNYRALNSVISMTKWLFWSYLIRKTGKIRNIHRFRRFYSQNIRRHNAMCRDELVAEVVENIENETWFPIHLLLHRIYTCTYRFYHQMNSINKCVIIESYVTHPSVSYGESLSCNSFLYSLRKHKWIETQLFDWVA